MSTSYSNIIDDSDFRIPRVSIVTHVVNYSPTVLAMFVYAAGSALFYFLMYLAATSSRVPYITYFALPLAFVVFAILTIIWGNYKGNVRNLVSWYTICHCIICITVVFVKISFFLVPLYCLLAILRGDDTSSIVVVFAVVVISLVQFLFLYYWLYGWVRFYLQHRYRKSYMRIAEERIGFPIFVSVPFFRSFGHIALVIDNWKYELRLSNPGRTAVFNSRLLTNEELLTFQETTFTYQWILVGWTRLTHEECNIRFGSLLEEFGPYHLVYNNCRHFVSRACRDAFVARNNGSKIWKVAHLPGSEDNPNPFLDFTKNFTYPFEAHEEQFLSFLFRSLMGPNSDSMEPSENEISHHFGSMLGLSGQTGLREWFISAPGQVTFSGEYVAVHGVTTIATSLDLRCYAVTTLRDDNMLSVHFRDLNDFSYEWDIDSLPWDAVSPGAARNVYLEVLDQELLTAISRGPLGELGEERKDACTASRAFLYMYIVLHRDKERPSFNFTTRSTLPIGAGLNSSAAFSACAAAALLLICRRIGIQSTLGIPRAVVSQVYRWVLISEKIMDGDFTSIDHKLTVCGGALAYTGAGFKRKYEIKPLARFKSLRFLLTNTKVPRDTKALITCVSERLASEPEVVTKIMEAIQEVSDEAGMVLTNEEQSSHSLISTLSALMNKNHECLITLGVSHPSLEAIRTKAAASPYKLSSKLTGNGRVGCVATLLPDDINKEFLDTLLQDLRQENFEPYLTRVHGTGLEVISISDQDRNHQQLDPGPEDLLTKFDRLTKSFMSFLITFPLRLLGALQRLWRLATENICACCRRSFMKSPLSSSYGYKPSQMHEQSVLNELHSLFVDGPASELADRAGMLVEQAQQMERWHRYCVDDYEALEK